MIDLVGDLFEGGNQRPAGEAQRLRPIGVDSPAQALALDDLVDRPLLESRSRSRSTNRSLRERFETLERVGMGPAASTPATSRSRVEPRAGRRQQLVEIETERRGERRLQAGHLAVRQPRQRPQRVRQRRHRAEHVQAVANLRRAQLAQVAVEVLDQMGDVVAAHLGQR